MPKFDIPVIATVVADSLEEAKKIICDRVDDLNDDGHTEFSIVDDELHLHLIKGKESQ